MKWKTNKKQMKYIECCNLTQDGIFDTLLTDWCYSSVGVGRDVLISDTRQWHNVHPMEPSTQPCYCSVAMCQWELRKRQGRFCFQAILGVCRSWKCGGFQSEQQGTRCATGGACPELLSAQCWGQSTNSWLKNKFFQTNTNNNPSRAASAS